MRRVARALVVLPLVLAACGGGKKSAATPSDPLAAVKAAAAKTTAAGSEHLALVASVVTGGQTVSLKGAGDVDTKAHLGSMHATLSTGSINGALDEVSKGTALYVKSDLLAALIPAGKTWIQLDVAKLAKSQGISSSLFSLDPSESLAQLQSLKNVTKVGTEQVGGAATTHYTAAIDVSKLPATAKAGSGTYDVWIGDDGYVHRVRVTIKSKSSNATVTSDLSGYGGKVSVTVPPASQVYDSRGAPIPGLGG
jgi:LppX_LprAFG lipoprotein